MKKLGICTCAAGVASSSDIKGPVMKGRQINTLLVRHGQRGLRCVPRKIKRVRLLPSRAERPNQYEREEDGGGPREREETETTASAWSAISMSRVTRKTIVGTKTESARSNPWPTPQNHEQSAEEWVAALWWACCVSWATVAGDASAGTISRQATRGRTKICRLSRITPSYRADAACIGLCP